MGCAAGETEGDDEAERRRSECRSLRPAGERSAMAMAADRRSSSRNGFGVLSASPSPTPCASVPVSDLRIQVPKTRPVEVPRVFIQVPFEVLWLGIEMLMSWGGGEEGGNYHIYCPSHSSNI
jgi:hypothetical protein